MEGVNFDFWGVAFLVLLVFLMILHLFLVVYEPGVCFGRVREGHRGIVKRGGRYISVAPGFYWEKLYGGYQTGLRSYRGDYRDPKAVTIVYEVRPPETNLEIFLRDKDFDMRDVLESIQEKIKSSKGESKDVIIKNINKQFEDYGVVVHRYH